MLIRFTEILEYNMNPNTVEHNERKILIVCIEQSVKLYYMQISGLSVVIHETLLTHEVNYNAIIL